MIFCKEEGVPCEGVKREYGGDVLGGMIGMHITLVVTLVIKKI